MRTTVEIPDDLFRMVKQATAERGCTFRELLTQALQKDLRDHGGGTKRSRRPLPAIRLDASAPILRMTPEALAEADHEAEAEKIL